METEIEIRVDPISLDIDQKLANISPTQFEHFIFRVHALLRKENEKAYEPTIVAIGPYHRDKNNLKPMEEHKFRYLQQSLLLNKESSVDRYVTALRKLEKRARDYYADSFDPLDSDEFVKMMLLDGFFILHFFRKHMFTDAWDMDPNDPIIQLSPTRMSICYDLMLFENQLPFFILVQLMNMTKFQGPKDNMVDLAQNCLKFVLPSLPNALEPSPPVSIDHNVHHLLGLMHERLCSSFVRFVPKDNIVDLAQNCLKFFLPSLPNALEASPSVSIDHNVHHILGLMHGMLYSSIFVRVVSTKKQGKQAEEWEFIKCTTELQEAGVKFMKATPTTMSLLDIQFDNGVMKIPPLAITDSTEYVLRNLIAYEQFRRNVSKRYFTDYAKFMDCLINSANDVEILRHKGIIVNWLGDDEVVSTMFNKLGNHVMMSSKNFCYSDIFNKVNRHCRQRRHIWLANLRRNYFNTPWSIISFIAAVVLILLTITQTICSILSYHK